MGKIIKKKRHLKAWIVGDNSLYLCREKCGHEFLIKRTEVMSEYQQTNGQQTIIIQKKTNGMGTAGFVLALLSFLFSWAPVVNWILWFLGALFSFIGLFKSPRGLAIAGFIISFINLFIILFLIGLLMVALAAV